MNKEEDLFKIALFLGAMILLVVGFSLGYLSVDKSCNNNPLIYGISELNKFNNDQFTCTCISNSGKINPFSFNEEGIIKNNFNKK